MVKRLWAFSWFVWFYSIGLLKYSEKFDLGDRNEEKGQQVLPTKDQVKILSGNVILLVCIDCFFPDAQFGTVFSLKVQGYGIF